MERGGGTRCIRRVTWGRHGPRRLPRPPTYKSDDSADAQPFGLVFSRISYKSSNNCRGTEVRRYRPLVVIASAATPRFRATHSDSIAAIGHDVAPMRSHRFHQRRYGRVRDPRACARRRHLGSARPRAAAVEAGGRRGRPSRDTAFP